MSLPRFIALKSNNNGRYLGCVQPKEFKDIHEGVTPSRNTFLRFDRDEISTTYTKFEVELAKIGNGLIHLKSCHNNKYWVRWSPSHWWIVAAADKPEEDRTKWSCTLFKPVYIDPNANMVRFLHLQLGHYACLWRIDLPFGDCLFGGSKDPDQDSWDVVTIIDWELLSTSTSRSGDRGAAMAEKDDDLDHDNNITSLPRFIVLKSNYNERYLGCVHPEEFRDIHQGVAPSRNNFLRFDRDDISTTCAKFEVELAKIGNGLVHLKSCHNNKYWVRWSPSHWWIVAAADKPEEDRTKWSCTLFKPVYIDLNANTIRFLHLQLGHYACLWRNNLPFGYCLFGGSKDLDQDSCDIVTVIDWELLSTSTSRSGGSGAAMAEEDDDSNQDNNITSLPRFIVLKSNYNERYLGCVHPEEFRDIHEGVAPSRNSFLRFDRDEISTIYTKFEVEPAKIGNGLVHLKSCHNNKYWVRWSPSHWWIVAAAGKPEEDRTKWSCTLFKPVYIDPNANTVRFLHLQLGHYACLWRINLPFGYCLFGGSNYLDRDSCDVITVIDWESLSTSTSRSGGSGATMAEEDDHSDQDNNITSLPRFIVLKSNYNERYLGVPPSRNSFLLFDRDKISTTYTKFEVEPAKIGNGLVHLMSCHNNKYWVRFSPSHWGIVAAADESEEDQCKWSCTLFKPIYVDRNANTVRFIHLQLIHYVCLWRTGLLFGDCLFARSINPDRDSCDVFTVMDWESPSSTSSAVDQENKISTSLPNATASLKGDRFAVQGTIDFSQQDISDR